MITDVMMPHVDGFELTRLLRQDPRTATISVIILTARGLSADKLEGFAIGADDYIVKPFDTPELLARVRGVLRRSKEMRDESPLTGLPGNGRVQEEVESTVAAGRGVRAAARRPRPVQGVQRPLRVPARRPGDPGRRPADRRRSSPSSARASAFVGHLGGDDFVVVVPPASAALVADTIVQRFDERRRATTTTRTSSAGGSRCSIDAASPSATGRSRSRSGSRARSAARSRTSPRSMAVATEMKNFTKATPGSSWAIDRRDRG